MACWRTPVDLLDAERVRPDPADLLEVERAPLPAPGRVHAALHERAARLEHAHLDLEGLGLADGVVDDVDAAGVAHRHAGQTLHGRAQHAARPRRQLLDHLRLRSSEPERPVGAELAWRASAWASKRATTPTSTSGYSARRIAIAHEPSDAGAPHEHPAVRGRRVAGDAVQRHRERIGEDRVLVVDRVGNREEHRGVRRHQLGVAAGRVARHAGVDARADRRRRRSSSTG